MKKLQNLGFDIKLADAITELKLTHDEIAFLGRETKARRVANAKSGHQTYYRKATLVRLFNR